MVDDATGQAAPAVEDSAESASRVPEGTTDVPEVERQEGDQVTESGESTEGEPSESSTENEEPKGDSLQGRMGELTKARRTAERRASAAEREAAYWREQAQATPPPEKGQESAPAEQEPAKTLEDFDYDDARYEAYKAKRAEERAVAAADRRIQERAAQEAAARQHGEYLDREAEFAESAPDYYDATRADSFAYTEQMHGTVAAMDDGPAVLYYLSKNSQVSERLARMPPREQAAELGRIAGRLEVQAAAAPKVSETPAPPPKLKGRQSGATQKDWAKMSFAEYRKARRERVARRGSRAVPARG